MNQQNRPSGRWRGRAMTGMPVARATARATDHPATAHTEWRPDTEQDLSGGSCGTGTDSGEMLRDAGGVSGTRESVRPSEPGGAPEPTDPAGLQRAIRDVEESGGDREGEQGSRSGRRRPSRATSSSFRTARGAGTQEGDESSEDLHERARAIVLRQLTATARSRKQLADKLAEREIPESVASEVLDRFEAVNLVDDRAFAAMFVRSRAETRKLSRSALRRELQQRGITGAMAEDALDQRTDQDELQDAHDLVRKKLPTRVDLSDRKEKDKHTRRLVSMLGRKGYGPGLAFTVVSQELQRLAGSGHAEPDAGPAGAPEWDTP